MRPRTKASLLWGAVGALVFLVLIQGYELLATPRIGFPVKLAVAAVAWLVTAGASYAFEEWVAGSERS